MKTQNHYKQEGSTLLTSVVMLGISTAVVASIISLITNYSRFNSRSMNADRAFYLSDAGLRCAVQQLINGGDRIILQNDSKAFFSEAQPNIGSDYGFTTRMESLGGKVHRLVSVGYCNGIEQQSQITCYDASTNKLTSDLLRTALYEGSQAGTLTLHPTDFINGPVHVQSNLDANGAQLDRCEEDLGNTDLSNDKNARLSEGEAWIEAGNPTIFEGPATRSEFEHQKNWARDNYESLNTDDLYNPGEAFIDKGNGVQDSDEPSMDRFEREAYHLRNPAVQITRVGEGDSAYWYADEGNGVYDLGEDFVDDRNAIYDRGVTAQGTIQGLAGTRADGELEANGNDLGITAPDLSNMYYDLPNDELALAGAYNGWGHDIKIDATTFGGSSTGDGIAQMIDDPNQPEHIFVRNPPRKNLTEENEIINGVPQRIYHAMTYPDNYEREDLRGQRIIDDYFLEDPTHESYGSTGDQGRRNLDMALANNDLKSGFSRTSPEYIDVKESGNNKVYFVDGNLYLHNASAFAMRFAEPGTKITIVARGNITVSDEFYYNGTYGDLTVVGDDLNDWSGSKSIDYNSAMSSTSIEDPMDNLCLIAMKSSDADRILGEGSTGNIYIGDAGAGTGGSIHAFLYAENNFIDNNLNTSDQKFISVYGCMAAGNKIDIQREGENPTRLDVSLDPRGDEVLGTPPPTESDVPIIHSAVADWRFIPGTWQSSSIAGDVTADLEPYLNYTGNQ